MADRIRITQEKMEKLFRDLAEHGNFEISERDGSCYVAYMMNDAVEDYLILTQAEVIGDLPEGAGKIAELAVIRGEARDGLKVQMKDGSFCTVWYDKSFRSMQCYDQSRLMHCWVPHEEYMRRLVYQVATMNDKEKYHPDGDIANEKERALTPLMQFRPFYFWSPIPSSIGAYYGETEEGIETFRKIAEEAGDTAMLRQLKRYRFSSWLFGPQTAIKVLRSEACYRVLLKKIREACAGYPRRSYGKEEDARIEEERKKITERFCGNGWHGMWPRFEKEKTAVEVFEEEPFTVLEQEDFTFEFKYMIEKRSGKRIRRGMTEKLDEAVASADE